MNDADAIVALLGLLRSAVAVPVLTEEGERAIHVPGIVLTDVDFVPLRRRHGHQTWAGTTTDETGAETGYEQHFYYEMDVTLVARSESEEEADDLQAQVFAALAPYVDDARSIDADLLEIELGRASRKNDPIREPEWFEAGRQVTLRYLTRVTTTADRLASIDHVIDPDL